MRLLVGNVELSLGARSTRCCPLTRPHISAAQLKLLRFTVTRTFSFRQYETARPMGSRRHVSIAVSRGIVSLAAREYPTWLRHVAQSHAPPVACHRAVLLFA